MELCKGGFFLNFGPILPLSRGTPPCFRGVSRRVLNESPYTTGWRLRLSDRGNRKAPHSARRGKASAPGGSIPKIGFVALEGPSDTARQSGLSASLREGCVLAFAMFSSPIRVARGGLRLLSTLGGTGSTGERTKSKGRACGRLKPGNRF